MKLLKTLLWSLVIVPFTIVLLKAIGLLSWSWIVVLLLASGYPIGILSMLLLMVIWLIKTTPEDEWKTPL